MTEGKEIVPYDLFDSWPIDRFFDQFWYGRWPASRFPRFPDIPEMTVKEKDGEVVVETPVAGIPIENLKVTYDGGRLRVEGSTERADEGGTTSRRVGYEALLAIDAGKAEATLENGMLTIKAPAGTRIEATKIPVKAAVKK